MGGTGRVGEHDIAGFDLDIETGVGSLQRQLAALHDQVGRIAPAVDRIACAVYDPHDDLLKTFVNSTRNGTALRAYDYELSRSASLSELARSARPRLVTDIQESFDPSTAHSAYVLAEGFESSFTVPMRHRGEFLGFVFFDSRDPDTFRPEVVRELLLHAHLISLAIANELVAISSVIGALQLARDFTQLRDHETAGHLDRMSRYARLIARELSGKYGFEDADIEHLFLYAPMHDIGKIGIPDSILLKPGHLDPDEWTLMKSHAVKGAGMVDAILRDLDLADVPDEQMLRDIVELHHEKLDGSGYPHGLRGDEIPPAARIVAVADMFDALTTRRSYKEPWTVDDALTELRRNTMVGLIDPDCVDALSANLGDVERIRTKYAEPDDEQTS